MAWSAFLGILAIIAIVVVSGGLIAVIARMVLNIWDFDKDKVGKEETPTMDYAQFKQQENGYTNVNQTEMNYSDYKAQETSKVSNKEEFQYAKEYDFDAINTAKAKEEEKLAMADSGEDEESVYQLLEKEADDEDLEAIENRLKTENAKPKAEPAKVQKSTPVEEIKPQPKAETVSKVSEVEEDDDFSDFDIDSIVSEISDDVVNDAMEKEHEEAVTPDSTLKNYNIDEIMKSLEEYDDEEDEEDVEIDETPKSQPVKNVKQEDDLPRAQEQPTRFIDEESRRMIEELRSQINTSTNRSDEETRKAIEELKIQINNSTNKSSEETKKAIEELKAQVANLSKSEKSAEAENSTEAYNEAKKTIEDLKAQVEDLTKKLEQAQGKSAQVRPIVAVLPERIPERVYANEQYTKKIIDSLRAQVADLYRQLDIAKATPAKPVEDEAPKKRIEELMAQVASLTKELEAVKGGSSMVPALRPIVAALPEKIPERIYSNERYTKKIIETLRAQVEDLYRQLDIAKSAPVAKSSTTNVVVTTINMTESECVKRLELLEERLKSVKKDYKINLKEYKPLKRVMVNLEKYQTKLRRKETIVAKKKVALYGVNNYVDIDKEKAEKLANEIELLDGLRLSVNHCEEVIEANKDRFPILEHTNNILEAQIADIEADIATTQETLRRIREKNGSGSNGDDSNNE